MGRPVGFAKTLLFAPVAWLVTFAGPACAQGLVASATPEQMARSEFSLQKAGEVHTPSSTVDESATSIPPPAPAEERAAETPVVGPVPAPVPVAQALPAEVLALDSNMSARVNDLLACRLEIAADRRVQLKRVAAGQVLLRWTVQPGGGVAGAEAVAQRSTDPDVLSCAKRKMESWVFVRAPGGEPLRIEQPLTFE
jgi:hypothetical protein